MRGRKPKPSALRLFEGNPGKRSINKDEPAPDPGISAAPEHLSEVAKTAWAAVSIKLDKIGVLTVVDDWALEQLCENYAEILDLRATIKTEGRFRFSTDRRLDKDSREKLRQVFT